MQSLWFYNYRIRFYDEVDDVMRDEIGITADLDLVKVVKRICRYYGEGNIESLEINYMNEDVVTFKGVEWNE